LKISKLRVAFAVASVLFLVVLAISPLKDYFREWRGYQQGYNALISQLPQRVKPAEIGIKQIWSQKLNRIDRCETCHLGITQVALAHAPQPFRQHPWVYHDIEEFGCTTCHEGQGAATTTEEAHGQVKYWESPLLPAAYVEASCGKCHKEENVPEAPLLTLGRKLIRESNCVACHKIAGFSKQWVPNLNGIGTKVNRAWIVSWLKDPKAYNPLSKMPNFHFTDEEANVLADFLTTFKTFSNGAELEPLPKSLAASSGPAADKMVEAGTTLFREARCITCHLVNGRGGTSAPELATVASKVREQWLYNYIEEPKRLQPGVEMPRYRFKKPELANVVSYIENQFVDYGAQQPPAHTPEPNFYEKGLALFKKYNCAGCHTLDGMQGAEVMGPDLSFIGSKKLYEIDFGQSGIEETLPSYLFTKLEHPRVFSATMKMPDYQFSDEQARAIAVALLSMTDDPIPDALTIQPHPESTFAPQGKFGKLVDELACLGCHKMEGRGKEIAPDLSLEASEARRKWIEGYFKVPYSIRPILTERMPNLFLPDSEIKSIAGYMETVFRADSLEHDIKMDPGAIAQGRILYYGTYGCQSCHLINLKGGYVGPPLDRIGSRLTPGWVFHWLKNPQAFKPETIEPNNKLTDKEAEALTAFLMSLK